MRSGRKVPRPDRSEGQREPLLLLQERVRRRDDREVQDGAKELHPVDGGILGHRVLAPDQGSTQRQHHD